MTHKYGAKKTEHNGVMYDSKAEADFASLLDTLGIPFERQPEIVLQPRFSDELGTVRPICYVSDFKVGTYFIDVKGVSTPEFRLKSKMFRIDKFFGETEFTLLIAKRKGSRFVLWEWEEPRKNSKRKSFDIGRLK